MQFLKLPICEDMQTGYNVFYMKRPYSENDQKLGLLFNMFVIYL